MDTNAGLKPVDTLASVSAIPAEIQMERSRAAEAAERASRYRLIIEEGATQGSFIYKTLDSVTGEIVRQLPREEVLKLAETADYGSGSLIDTLA